MLNNPFSSALFATVRSINSLIHFIPFLDVHPLLAHYLPETYYSCDYIQSIPSTNTTIILPDYTCNEMNYTTFDFSRFTDLEYLDIGDNSFRSVDTFIIDGMHNLTTLIIGKKSFLSVRYYDGWNPGTSFHIKNCELLKSIEIGKNSFTDYTGIFELINLPSLQTVNIGDMIDDGIQECNFFYSSFVIRGNYLIMIGNLFRSPEITIY